ncbi:DUF397 domain-containing protein [Amycolatopsis sp. NPDC004378]
MTVPEIPEEIWEENGFKSSWSGNDDNCVEVVFVPTADVVGVRDTKDREGGQLVLPTATWRGLVTVVRSKK